jgi:hypothetical protein
MLSRPSDPVNQTCLVLEALCVTPRGLGLEKEDATLRLQATT